MQNDELINELCRLLDKAAALASQFSGGYSNHFDSAGEFHSALVESIRKLRASDRTQLQILWEWFAPTCDWDDLIGQDGAEVGNKIFTILDGQFFVYNDCIQP